MPKYENINPNKGLRSNTIVKEIPTNNNSAISFSVSDFDLEDDDETLLKKNHLQSISYSLLFCGVKAHDIKQINAHFCFTIHALHEFVASYILVGNFRI